MRTILTASLLVAASLVSTGANAALLGLQVNGVLNFNGVGANYYDPSNGLTPAGYGNSAGQPVTIGAITEFGFADGFNTDTADFTDTQLIIRDQMGGAGAFPWTQTFTLVGGPAFSSLSLASSTFQGLTYALNAGTITVNWAGANGAGDFNAVFNVGVGPAGVPEPATWAMLIAGFGLIGGAMRNRKRATVAYA